MLKLNKVEIEGWFDVGVDRFEAEFIYEVTVS
jgi:hypothetical protein